MLLISTVLTSFGWYLSCNKPCDPEIITVKGDTVYLKPEPVSVISLNEKSDTNHQKGGLLSGLYRKVNYHKVKKGETIYGIATRGYGIPAISLMQLNGLTSDTIQPNQKLYVGTPEQRDSIRQSLKSDSLYTYEKEFGDKAVKGRVITQSTGPMLSQSIYWESRADKPRNRLFVGGSVDRLRTLSAIGAFELKSGIMVTGQVGVIGTNNVQIGVLKRIK